MLCYALHSVPATPDNDDEAVEQGGVAGGGETDQGRGSRYKRYVKNDEKGSERKKVKQTKTTEMESGRAGLKRLGKALQIVQEYISYI